MIINDYENLTQIEWKLKVISVNCKWLIGLNWKWFSENQKLLKLNESIRKLAQTDYKNDSDWIRIENNLN